MGDENLRRDLKEELLTFLPYIRAGLDAYKTFERSLEEYKRLSPEEVYKRSPVLLRLIFKLFESDIKDFFDLVE